MTSYRSCARARPTGSAWRSGEKGTDGSTNQWEEDPFRAFSPGGESWAGFLVRAGAALARIVSKHPDETVVAVCHGGVLEASFYLAFGVSGTGNRLTFAPLNTGVTHWRHEHRPGGAGRWTLVTYNDASHLTGTTLPAEPSHDAFRRRQMTL